MSLVRYNPFDDLFRTFGNVGEPISRQEWFPAVDIVENENAYDISLEVPAVARENSRPSIRSPSSFNPGRPEASSQAVFMALSSSTPAGAVSRPSWKLSSPDARS